MILPDPTPEEILYVVQNMREMSREEIFCATDSTPEQFADYVYRGEGFRYVGYHNKKPAAIVGAHRTHGKNWSLYGFGTDDWIKIWRPMTRCTQQDLIPAVYDTGAIRADAITRSDHKMTRKWLRYLGATIEVELPQWGNDGEDYVMLAWLRDGLNVRRRIKERR